jgi:hypothetical protein
VRARVMVNSQPPLACPLKFGAVPKYHSRFLVQCQHTNWIGLCGAILWWPLGPSGTRCWWLRVGHQSQPSGASLAHTALATGTSRHSACGREWRPVPSPIRRPPLAAQIRDAIGTPWCADGRQWRPPLPTQTCLHWLTQRSLVSK